MREFKKMSKETFKDKPYVAIGRAQTIIELLLRVKTPRTRALAKDWLDAVEAWMESE